MALEPPTCHRHPCPHPRAQRTSTDAHPSGPEMRVLLWSLQVTSRSSPQQVTVLSSPREEQTGGLGSTAGEVEGCQVLCQNSSWLRHVAQARAMASGLKERPREVPGRPSCWSRPWSLKAEGRVGDSTLVSEWLTTRSSIHTGDCHAARTPGLACGPWTQAGRLPCGAGLSTPLPQAASPHAAPAGTGAQHSGVSTSLWAG